MHDKCTGSELIDAKKINYLRSFGAKEGRDDIERRNGVFVYAAYLKPGLHQFVIFDPESGRAFCKELMIDLNNQVAEFPELPTKIGEKRITARVQNVWAPWIKDSEAQKRKAVNLDTKDGSFQLELFIKAKGQPVHADIKAIIGQFDQNFDTIKVI